MNDSKSYVPWDGWRRVRLLGHGSFGKVYEIEKASGDRVKKAAMKVITIDADMFDVVYGSQYNEESARRVCEDSLNQIRREYELMYELRGNPNIVRCDDMQVVKHPEGIGFDVYIMMELLTPLGKAETVRGNAEETVQRLGEDICSALIACERHNIIHRDIKPQNILVTDNGTFKLGDFGTAKNFEHTASATMAGTESYMAPEIIKREKYGRDVDTYSLGLVMYRMLNKGQLPFIDTDKIPMASDRSLSLQRRLSGEPLPPPAEGSQMLKAIVLRACSFNRTDRYSSASDMLEDLLQAAERTEAMFGADPSDRRTVLETKYEPEQMPDRSIPEQPLPGSQTQSAVPPEGKGRSKGMIIGIAAAVLALVIGIAAFAGDQGGPDDTGITPEPKERTETQEEEKALTEKSEAGEVEPDFKDYLDNTCYLTHNDAYTVEKYAVRDFDNDGDDDLLVVYRDNFEATFYHLAMFDEPSDSSAEVKLIRDEFDESYYSFYDNGIIKRIEQKEDPYTSYYPREISGNVTYTYIYDMFHTASGALSLGEDEYMIYEDDGSGNMRRYKAAATGVEGKEEQKIQTILDETEISSSDYYNDLNEYQGEANNIVPVFETY